MGRPADGGGTPAGPLDDPRFWMLREALDQYASDPDDPQLRAGDALQAAVALILRGGEELELLLIKRARLEGDPWSGHMALPGGRREEADASLLDTAVRETREEVGIRLSGADALHVGRLEEVSPVSTRLPSIGIHPYVFGVHPGTEAHADSVEVAAVHWVSVALLRRPDAVEEVEIRLRDETARFPCFRVDGEVVWGLTYRILTGFLDVAPELLRET